MPNSVMSPPTVSTKVEGEQPVSTGDDKNTGKQVVHIPSDIKSQLESAMNMGALKDPLTDPSMQMPPEAEAILAQHPEAVKADEEAQAGEAAKAMGKETSSVDTASANEGGATAIKVDGENL